MADKNLIIPTDAIESDFQDFISPDSNKRIIFSGPFGIGKTYFLNKFFTNKNEEYLSIFLRPVNYSLLSNEDVFKLIKYDILYQIVELPEFNIEEEFKLTKGDYTKFFVADHGFSILSNLLKLIPKIQTAVDGVEKIRELIMAYKEGLEKIEQTEELKMLFGFQKESQETFLLEYDNVSQYISQKLDEIAEKNTKGESLKKVLIIDDLDRLDPEHIFRLFNVFSAHFDQVNYYSEERGVADNKFGFDKIIFVCDIENIRKIFAHRFGERVDFSGYIDKFYSSEIYSFFHHLDFRENIYPYFEKMLQRRFQDDYHSMFFNATKLIFQLLYENQEISIRDMEKIKKLTPLAFRTKGIVVPFTSCFAPKDSYISTYGILISLRLFRSLFGDNTSLFSRLERAISKNKLLKDGGYFRHEVAQLIPQLILFSEIEVHKFAQSDRTFQYKLLTGALFEYTVETSCYANQHIHTGPYRYNIKFSEEREWIDEYPILLKSSIMNISKYGLLVQ